MILYPFIIMSCTKAISNDILDFVLIYLVGLIIPSMYIYLAFRRTKKTRNNLKLIVSYAIKIQINALFVSVIVFVFITFISSRGYVFSVLPITYVLKYALYQILIIAMIEEFLFRKTLFKVLREYISNDKVIIVVSSVIFMLSHIFVVSTQSLGVIGLILPLLSGIVFGYVYATTNNIALVIFIHATMNIFGLNGVATRFASFTMLIPYIIVVITIVYKNSRRKILL